MNENSGLVEALNSSTHDDELRVKVFYMEESISKIMENIISLADYIDEKFINLNNEVYSLTQRMDSLESRYTTIEETMNNLEKYLISIQNLPKEETNEVAIPPSVRSLAIGLLSDLYNPNKTNESTATNMAPKLSMPPPPKAPIVQNNTKTITNEKPSHGDLMSELKKRFEILKQRAESDEDDD